MDNPNLIEECELEFQDMLFAWHKKGLNYKQLWSIVHDLEKKVTTEVIGESYVEISSR